MCSNRSMHAGKTWRDEYGEGIDEIFGILITVE
jgi:hypothetical protein